MKKEGSIRRRRERPKGVMRMDSQSKNVPSERLLDEKSRSNISSSDDGRLSRHASRLNDLPFSLFVKKEPRSTPPQREVETRRQERSRLKDLAREKYRGRLQHSKRRRLEESGLTTKHRDQGNVDLEASQVRISEAQAGSDGIYLSRSPPGSSCRPGLVYEQSRLAGLRYFSGQPSTTPFSFLDRVPRNNKVIPAEEFLADHEKLRRQCIGQGHDDMTPGSLLHDLVQRAQTTQADEKQEGTWDGHRTALKSWKNFRDMTHDRDERLWVHQELPDSILAAREVTKAYLEW